MSLDHILLLHNDYASFSGEEFIYDQTKQILTDRGHSVTEYRRSSNEVGSGTIARLSAFANGIHSRQACRQITDLIRRVRPSVAHVQNVYPLLSPGVTATCRREGLPVVMNIQNFRLGCPTGLFFSKGTVCRKCEHGNGLWCFTNNCTGSNLKSLAYALRYTSEKVVSTYKKNVTHYIVPTQFHKTWLESLRFPQHRITVIPNMTGAPNTPPITGDEQYVAFAGRMTESKGIRVLLDAAKRLPDVSFRMAGPASLAEQSLLHSHATPDNVKYLGQLSGHALQTFYDNMTMLVVPSIWYEGQPTVIPQAMWRAKPVVASDIGGLSFTVQHNRTGLLSKPGDAAGLAEAIRTLWHRPELRRLFGQNAEQVARAAYSHDAYYSSLIRVFAQARNDFPD